MFPGQRRRRGGTWVGRGVLVTLVPPPRQGFLGYVNTAVGPVSAAVPGKAGGSLPMPSRAGGSGNNGCPGHRDILPPACVAWHNRGHGGSDRAGTAARCTGWGSSYVWGLPVSCVTKTGWHSARCQPVPGVGPSAGPGRDVGQEGVSEGSPHREGALGVAGPHLGCCRAPLLSVTSVANAVEGLHSRTGENESPRKGSAAPAPGPPPAGPFGS